MRKIVFKHPRAMGVFHTRASERVFAQFVKPFFGNFRFVVWAGFRQIQEGSIFSQGTLENSTDGSLLPPTLGATSRLYLARNLSFTAHEAFTLEGLRPSREV